MDILGLVGSGISSILTGGATGLAGVVIQRWFDLKKGEQDLAIQQAKDTHELAMRDKDALLMDKEWQGRLRVAEAEGEKAATVAAEQSFQATLLREPERYSNAATLTPRQQWVMVLLDFCRGIVRPGLTVYLCALTTYIWFQVRGLLNVSELAAGDVLDVWRTVVATVLYLTTTVILWWFGTRNKAPQPVHTLRGGGGHSPSTPAR